MRNLILTPEERNDLHLNESKALSGIYCQQCDACRGQCPSSVDIPTFMRSYMYAYGYRNMGLAQEILNGTELTPLPCNGCRSCSVSCTMGFDIRNKILDITRLKDIPQEFLA
jgi:predicted aldo/keto reductase-like oxidoreductase